jgi:myosin heavy subunit
MDKNKRLFGNPGGFQVLGAIEDIANKLQAHEKEIEHLRDQNTKLQAHEKEIEHHKKEIGHLRDQNTKLQAHEKEIEHHKKEIGHLRDQNTKLQAHEKEIEHLRDQNTKLQAHEKEIEHLRDQNTKLQADDEHLHKKLQTHLVVTKGLRRGILEDYARRRKSDCDGSSKVMEQRNCIAHGGDVSMDVEMITETEDRTSADKWERTFEKVYHQKFQIIRDLFASMPEEIISTMNIVGNTELHRNIRNHTQIPDKLRDKFRSDGEAMVKEWINSQTLTDDLKKRCFDLELEFTNKWAW